VLHVSPIRIELTEDESLICERWVYSNKQSKIAKIQTKAGKLNNLIKDVTERYDNFEFDSVYRDITNFVTRELSAFYLDFTKDVLYIEKADNHARRSIQTVLYDTTLALLQLLTPFLPHTTNEAYLQLPSHSYGNVYLENMPEYVELGELDLVENMKTSC